MRVIAGAAKGRRLSVPPGTAVRPSSARVRESAFGILAHRDAIFDAAVLDLFAGSGALGLEALSRDARSLVAVEQDRSAARALRQNLTRCGFASSAEVVEQTVAAAIRRLAREGRRFDLVFVDPPYRAGLIEPTLAALVDRNILVPGAWVVVEHSNAETVGEPAGFSVELVRQYGDKAVTLLCARSGSEVAVDAIQ
jgi:16S rRNA (guanine(966)-N(2))-methyltransferase RsmD